MTARLQMGYWHFKPPIGYKRKKVKGHGKMFVPDEPYASIVKEALEGYAVGRFQTPAEVSSFLRGHPLMQPKIQGKKYPFKDPVSLLTNRIYTGFFEYPKWEVRFMRGQHEPLISMEMYNRIQDRLSGRAISPIRKDIKYDFPLRGFLQCDSCGHHLTAAWSKGRSKMYGYYACHNKACPDRRKSIRKEKVEGEFSEALKQLEPSQEVLDVARCMLKDIWDNRQGQVAQSQKEIENQIAELERDSEAMLDRIISASDTRVIEAYEKRLAKQTMKQEELKRKLEDFEVPQRNFEEMFEPVAEILSRPWKVWKNSDCRGKKALLRMLFVQEASYSSKAGLRTGELSFPFKVLSDRYSLNEVLVEPRGVEPLTSCMPCKRSPN